MMVFLAPVAMEQDFIQEQRGSSCPLHFSGDLWE
jgi:hypothetical protein